MGCICSKEEEELKDVELSETPKKKKKKEKNSDGSTNKKLKKKKKQEELDVNDEDPETRQEPVASDLPIVSAKASKKKKKGAIPPVSGDDNDDDKEPEMNKSLTSSLLATKAIRSDADEVEPELIRDSSIQSPCVPVSCSLAEY